MLTEAWEQLRPHPQQSALWRTSAKTVIVPAGRGSGKSLISKRYCVRWLPIEKPWTDPIYFYALPTYNQAKRVAWKDLKALTPHRWVKRIYESDLIISTVFGSELHVLGMDKPMRAEGVQWDGGVLDESSDQKPGIVEVNLGPAMTHRDPWLWRIGVPKRYGVGAKDFKQAYDNALACTDGTQAAFSWPSSDILEPSVIEARKAELDPIDYAEQYEASWEKAGGLVFHCYDSANLDDQIGHIPDKALIIGQDFNVDPMAWTLSHKVGNDLHTFDEIWIRNTNTQSAMDALWDRYGEKHQGWWVFIGDATGRSRKTSATTTDYLIIKGDERFKRKRVHYPKSNPVVLDRFAACNALLKNAKGLRRGKIHPRCKHLIEDLENRSYKEGTREPDDKGDISHMSDAWGYVVHQLFPIPVSVGGGTAGVHAGAE